METLQKIYPPRGTLSNKNRLATFDSATPWKDANVSFNWLNFDYPLSHGHTDWEILIVLQGEILHQINGTSTLLTPGMGCLIGPEDIHSFTYPKQQKNNFQGVCMLARDFYMQDFLKMYSLTLYEEILTHKNPLYFSISRNSLEKYTDILLSVQNYNYNEKTHCQQQCNIVFTYLLLKLLEQQVSPLDIPNELKDFVRRLNNPSITKEELQNTINALPYSYSQLTRLFKKHLNCTITQYVNQVKMNYAKELLSNTEIPVSQIAEKLQFDSSAHFHTLFKKTFHRTPLEYRKLK